MDVPVNSELRGIRTETLNQRVEIPRDAMVDVETKELSKGRTYGLVAFVVASLVWPNKSRSTALSP